MCFSIGVFHFTSKSEKLSEQKKKLKTEEKGLKNNLKLKNSKLSKLKEDTKHLYGEIEKLKKAKYDQKKKLHNDSDDDDDDEGFLNPHNFSPSNLILKVAQVSINTSVT